MDADKAKLVIRLESSADSAAGATAAYLLRRLAARAGAYAPGIQESLFYEIAQNANGSTLEKVARWLEVNSANLTALGYRVLFRRTAVLTSELLTWIEEGGGYRGAVLAVDGTRLYRKSSMSTSHAVGLTYGDSTSGVTDPKLQNSLVMLEAAPGMPKFDRPPNTLDAAHRAYKYGALVLCWTGHT